MSVEVAGKNHRWSFQFTGDPSHLKDWIDDGLDVSIVVNSIPQWIVNLGLTRAWVFFQDAFNFWSNK